MTASLRPDRDRIVRALERLAIVDQRSNVWKLPEHLIIEAAVLLMTPGTSPADVYRFLCDQGHKPGGLSGWYRFVRVFRGQFLAMDELSNLHALPLADVAGRLQMTPQAVEGLVRTGKLTKREISGESRIPAASLRRFLVGSTPAQSAVEGP